MNQEIKRVFKQQETHNVDGMDMALCVVDEIDDIMHFSGAKNPLIYIQRNELFVIPGEKIGIGGFDLNPEQVKIYNSHDVKLDCPTWFYLMSDGYQDQFGGPLGKKFMIKRLKELLLENHQLPMEQQKDILIKSLEEWMQGVNQVDDIILMGVYLDPDEFERW